MKLALHRICLSCRQLGLQLPGQCSVWRRSDEDRFCSRMSARIKAPNILILEPVSPRKKEKDCTSFAIYTAEHFAQLQPALQDEHCSDTNDFAVIVQGRPSCPAPFFNPPRLFRGQRQQRPFMAGSPSEKRRLLRWLLQSSCYRSGAVREQHPEKLWEPA